jgi:uncharacterized protein YbcV (DUF1398 family)
MIAASVITIAFEACARSQLGFRELLAKLARLGVDRYQADLVRCENTCYVANGSFVVPAPLVRTPPAPTLSPIGIEVATRALFRRRIGYDELRERAAVAGCTSYQISIAGNRAAFFGRLGESCSEPLQNRPTSVTPALVGVVAGTIVAACSPSVGRSK